jgi:hypothetical protein
MLSIIFPISTIYTFSIKSHNSYLNIFSILPPIATFYRLIIVSFYRHLYTKYIQITYNITYKGSLDFGIPSVTETTAPLQTMQDLDPISLSQRPTILVIFTVVMLCLFMFRSRLPNTSQLPLPVRLHIGCSGTQCLHSSNIVSLFRMWMVLTTYRIINRQCTLQEYCTTDLYSLCTMGRSITIIIGRQQVSTHSHSCLPVLNF